MNDTIAALATPPLTGAVGIIRVSGPDAFSIVSEVFFPGKGGFSRIKPRVMTYGSIRVAGERLDNALCVLFNSPRSYTGEDMAELHMHGSIPALRATLEGLYLAGARPANAGEFTKRAFLHGKLSLSQSEAVMDLITAETRDAVRNAAGQLNGKLGKIFSGVYSELSDALAHYYAVIDYPDDDLPQIGFDELHSTLGHVIERLGALAATRTRGSLLRDGLRCAIIGKPNVGKSSFMNAILGYERAIVSPTAGTTRDTIEESAIIGGMKLRLTDSAGIHEPSGDVEAEGVSRAQQAALEAELVFLVLDGSQPLDENDRRVLDMVRDLPREDERLSRGLSKARHCVVIINKCDMPRVIETEIIEAAFMYVAEVSALTGEGLDRVDSALHRLFGSGSALYDGSVLTNDRQLDAVRRTLDAARRARRGLEDGITADAVLSELEISLEALSELTGRRVTDEIIEKIFANFCVGK